MNNAAKALQQKIAALKEALHAAENELAQNITPEKHVETPAEETKDYLETILTEMPGHVYWLNKDNVYLGCNKLQAQNAKLNSWKDIIGKTNQDMIWKDQAESLDKVNREVLKTGKEKRAVEFAVMSDGPGFYLSIKKPLRDHDNNIIGLLGVSFNVTEQIQMEKELKKAKKETENALKAKTEFIMNMSHDIRTPFSGILALSQLLEKKATDPEFKADLGLIANSSKKLLDLLNEILELAEIESAVSDIENEPVDLFQILGDVFGLMSAQAKNKRLEFSFDYADNLPRHFLSDKKRLTRILINLIGNAIKYTPEGFVKVSVKPLKVFEKEIRLLISIKDSGVGIPKDKIKSIFEPFTRLSSRYLGAEAGAGLGLYIAKEFISALSGDIEVKSTEKKGSIFSVFLTLPLADTQEETKPPETTYTTPRADLSGTRFLLIEDDLLSQLVAKKLLTSLHCSVDIAGTAAEGFELAKNNVYDMILMDIGLPDENGVELAKDIREKIKIKTPIIAITAHAPKSYLDRCKKAGIDEVISKPISYEKILNFSYHSFAENRTD